VLFLIVAGVAGYAVYLAGKPGQIIQTSTGGGGARGGSGGRGGRGNLGPTPVGVTKARKGSMPVYQNGLGTVAAYYVVAVKPRIDGQLMSVNFREGDMVKEGDLLAVVDPRPYEVQKAQAEGTFARDSALLSNAKNDLERYRGLLAKNAIPQQQYDTQVATVAQLEGTLKQDQAAIDNAKLQLTYSEVTAPISGRIGLRLVDPGNVVRAADPNGLLVITEIQPITVLFTVPEDALPQINRKVNAGKRLLVEAWNRDNSEMIAEGYLLTIDNQMDSTTGTSKMKAVFDNYDGALFPNQFVNIHLLVDTLCDQVIVPNVAVQSGQQGTYVYVVDADSKVHNRPVTVRLALASDSAIASGLAEGEQVVIDGTDRLVEGATVRVRTPDDVAGRGGRGGRGGSGRGGRGGGGGGRGAGNAGGSNGGRGGGIGNGGGGNAAGRGAGGGRGGAGGGRGGAGGGRGAGAAGGRGGRGGGGRGGSGGGGGRGARGGNAAEGPGMPDPFDRSKLDIGCPGDSGSSRQSGGANGGGQPRGGGRRGGAGQ
jgi:multidrug efflux system membrane fusion protein